MKDLSVLSLKLFFLIKAPLKKAKQHVCCFIYFTLTIINLKIVMREFLASTDLIRAQTLSIYELFNFIMVSKNENLMFIAF